MNKQKIISEIKNIQLLAKEIVLVEFLENDSLQKVLFNVSLIDAYSIYDPIKHVGGIKVGEYVFDNLVMDFDIKQFESQFLDLGNGMYLNKSQIISIEDSVMQLRLNNLEGKLFIETKDVRCFNVEMPSGLIRFHDEESLNTIKKYLDDEFKPTQYYNSGIKKDCLTDIVNEFLSDDEKLQEVIFVKGCNSFFIEATSVNTSHRIDKKRYFRIENPKKNIYKEFEKIYSLVEKMDLGLDVLVDNINPSVIKDIKKHKL